MPRMPCSDLSSLSFPIQIPPLRSPRSPLISSPILQQIGPCKQSIQSKQPRLPSTERERERKSSAAAMASGGFMEKKELGKTHDVLRFGVNNSVRGDLAPVHPVQAAIHKENKFWDEKKKFGTEAIYGSAFNIRKDLDAQILSRQEDYSRLRPLSYRGADMFVLAFSLISSASRAVILRF